MPKVIIDCPNSRILLSRKFLDLLGNPKSVFIFTDKANKTITIKGAQWNEEDKEYAAKRANKTQQKNDLFDIPITYSFPVVTDDLVTDEERHDACDDEKFGRIEKIKGLIPKLADTFQLSLDQSYAMSGKSLELDDPTYMFYLPD